GHAIAGGLGPVLRLAACSEHSISCRPHRRVGVRYPVSAIEIVRHELRPEGVRKLVLFAQNISGTAALEAGVFDEMVDPENLMQRALARAAEFAALPTAVFAKTKQQLRGKVSAMIETA